MKFGGFPDGADIAFDRRISPALLAAMAPNGPFSSLVERSNAGGNRFDVQLRRDPKGTRSWASFYVGLTTVLNIDENGGSFLLRADETHCKAGGFDEAWSTWSDQSMLVAHWPEIERYLNRVIPTVPERYTRAEGAVHGAICCGSASTYRVVQREASPAFRNTKVRTAISNSIANPLYAACDAAVADLPTKPDWWPGVRAHGKHKTFGTGLDVLAIGTDGRLLAIEAKAADKLDGIVWGPAQVRFYAEVFARWLAEPTTDNEVIDEMLAQRVRLGLAATSVPLTRPIRLVPMVLIGPGAVSSFARKRLGKLADVIEAVPHADCVQPLEVWRVDGAVFTEQWR